MAHRITSRDELGFVAACPFCGETQLDIETDDGYFVLCQACVMHGPLGCTEEYAVCLWNARFDAGRPPAAREAG